MPIPKPTSGESETDFMARCMDDRTMLAEYSQRDQRVAVCLTSYRDGKEESLMDDAPAFEECDEVKFVEGYIDCEADLELKAYHDDEDDENKGMFEGYASVFGNKDLGNDVVVNGAFRKSLRAKGARKIKMLFQHDTKEPIGVYTQIKEDGNGLYVKGQLAMNTQKGREVYELMKMGAIDGLSVGYRVDAKGYHYDERGKKRMLKEVDLMEISAVTFPMNPKARISAVKAEERSVRDWETFLRDEGGLSRSESKVAASAVSNALDQREVGDEQKGVMDSIANLTNILKS
jgi:HK97 family phage prohead protease